ncbi:hypothetical protein AB0425_32385 [Actinosynnema sp. NPDC051121]
MKRPPNADTVRARREQLSEEVMKHPLAALTSLIFAAAACTNDPGYTSNSDTAFVNVVEDRWDNDSPYGIDYSVPTCVVSVRNNAHHWQRVTWEIEFDVVGRGVYTITDEVTLDRTATSTEKTTLNEFGVRVDETDADHPRFNCHVREIRGEMIENERSTQR